MQSTREGNELRDIVPLQRGANSRWPMSRMMAGVVQITDVEELHFGEPIQPLQY